MFAALKSFLADLSGSPAQKGFDEDDYRVAAVALLIHVADSDGMIAEAECRRIKTLVKDQFQLDADAASALIAEAQRSEREAVDFYHFTHILKRSLDAAGRQKVVAMMWDIAFADGMVDEIEESVVWRVAELLDVPNRDRVLLRQKVGAEAKEREAKPINPWKLEPSTGES